MQDLAVREYALHKVFSCDNEVTAVRRWHSTFAEECSYRTLQRGNLVLLNRVKNSGARNYDFDTKAKHLAIANGSAAFALATQVLTQGERLRGCDRGTPALTAVLHKERELN